MCPWCAFVALEDEGPEHVEHHVLRQVLHRGTERGHGLPRVLGALRLQVDLL